MNNSFNPNAVGVHRATDLDGLVAGYDATIVQQERCVELLRALANGILKLNERYA